VFRKILVRKTSMQCFDKVTGDGWWRIFWIALFAPARAREADNRKKASQSVTCHLGEPTLFFPLWGSVVSRALNCGLGAGRWTGAAS
jgi:hypothetical protein